MTVLGARKRTEMWAWWALLVVLAIAGSSVEGRKGFGDGGQEYGYVDVRTGAHTFYWLFYANGGDAPANKPLVIWLQGGPGASSTSYGNFVEMGPLDPNLNKRSTTWVKYVNLLFIDNPVGTGYSYVDHSRYLATNNQQIAQDLVAFIKGFMKQYPQFQKVPLYVFCESYGGKMTAEFALNLYKAQKAGEVNSNLKGIALGDSWISPIDSVLTWAPYLLQMGLVDRHGFQRLDGVAQRARRAVNRGRYYEALQLWVEAETVAMDVANDVDFYNIMKRIPADVSARVRLSAARGDYADVLFHNHVLRASDAELNSLMDDQVKPALNAVTPGVIPADLRHQTSSSSVFSALGTDFMKPVTDIVEELLNTTDITVAVLSGQLDLIVDTPGTLAWAERLHWKMGDYWLNQARREPLVVNGVIEGFVKNTGGFSFYWVNRAGHMVPADNPAAAIQILKTVTGLK